MGKRLTLADRGRKNRTSAGASAQKLQAHRFDFVIFIFEVKAHVVKLKDLWFKMFKVKVQTKFTLELYLGFSVLKLSESNTRTRALIT